MHQAKKLIDKYEIYTEQKLGSGSYGTVYLAKDKNGRQLAIKCLQKKKISENPYGRKSLIFEIQTMRSLRNLDSEHIVKLEDILESKNYIYLVLEYCEDGDLKSHIRAKGPFSEPEAVAITRQIVDAFSALHSRGIIHRDLKPENILSSKGVFKLGDFGLAKVVDNEAAVNESYVGTPLYSCPQILSNKKYSSKCDVWSLACIYCQLLTGKTPFQASSIYELMQKVLNEEPELPVKISGISLDFLQRALKKSEEERLGWQGVYAHPLFNDKAGPERPRSQIVELASQIRRTVIVEGINILAQIKDNKLDIQAPMEFQDLIPVALGLMPFLCYQQALKLCNAARKPQHFTTIEDLLQLLRKNEIPLEGGPVQTPCFKKVDEDIEQSKLQEQALELVKKLRDLIDDDRVVVERYFQRGCIQFMQFKQMMEAVRPGVREELTVSAFQLFQPQFRGEIDIPQFQAQLKKLAGPFRKKASIRKGDYQPVAYFAPIHKK